MCQRSHRVDGRAALFLALAALNLGLLPVVAGPVKGTVGAMSAGEALVGAGLQRRVGRLAGQGESRGVMRASLPVAASGQRDLAEEVKRVDLRGTRAGVAGYGQRQQKLPCRILVTAPPKIDLAQARQRGSLADPLAELAGQRQAFLQVPGG